MKKEEKQPKNLEECYAALSEKFSTDELAKFMACSEDELIKYHMGLGMWMRNNWGLWEGGELQEYFKAMGIWHADDMSGIIIDSFHRHLCGSPIKLDEQAQYYKDYWKKYDK